MNKFAIILIISFLIICMNLPSIYGEEKINSGENVVAVAIQKTLVAIETSKKNLIKTRQKITNERMKTQLELSSLEEDVVSLRRKWRKDEGIEIKSQSRFSNLQDESQRLEQILERVRTTLLEGRRNIETRFSLLDSKAFGKQLEELDILLEQKDAEPEICTKKVLTLLADHIQGGLYIRNIPGIAIGSEGKEQTGTFVQVGNIFALFASKTNAQSSGLVRLQHGSAQPHVWSIKSKEVTHPISSLANGNDVVVPFDISGGAALRSMHAKRSISEEMKAGGIVMIPLLLLALICICVGLWKGFRLWQIPASTNKIVHVFLQNIGDKQETESLIERVRGPFGRVLKEASVHLDEQRDELEEVLHEAILAEMPALESKLSVLSIGAAIAPLLGLLGTVTGMIHTFQLISIFGTGDARMLSGGISEALVTTEVGLVVAIPLLLFHAVLSRRVRAIFDGLEKGALTILNEYGDTALVIKNRTERA